ncbi:YbaB/EbfC family nucleoid-associated protein [Chitinispirillales bacterium ANBcel5]|uniref:YbaB/EbfC family nucleoid-associated protein n=1 Tax=Cellulosispirillum alkaliphilum TaxID=3039283 RepID=UPI002A4F2944|nr:YbaB/EbfC family nucleoid-associated protein [Chitinispirillales bacterium ANBcel5]
MKNMNKLLKQAQKMQSQMMKAQEELQQKEVEGTAGGGMVKVMLNGKNELTSIKINPEVVDSDDVEMLEDLIIAAHQNAQEKIKEISESTYGSISGGLNIPGM